MATKNVLVHLGDDPETETRLQAGVNICKHFQAHLMALYYHEVKIPVGAVGRGGYLAENQEKIQQHAEDLRREVAKRCKAAKVEWDWARSDSEHFTSVFEYTSLSDLIIISQITVEDLEDRIFYKQTEELVMRAGAPFLMLPGGFNATGWNHPKKVMIAWKPTGEAIRAVRDALEIIQAASEVIVFTADVDPEKHDNPATGILRYLKSHGIDAVSDHHIQDSRIGDQIINVAQQHGVDLIVMGAYGQMGIKEKLFGGASRYIMTKCPVPVLLSH